MLGGIVEPLWVLVGHRMVVDLAHRTATTPLWYCQWSQAVF